MSVIEQAAKRLQELQRAGIGAAQVSEGESADSAASTPATRRREPDARSLHVRREVTLERTPEGGAAQPESGVASRRVELDLTRIAAAGIVTPDAPRSRIADEFRVVKRPLLANASRNGAAAIRNGNLIMITSSLPREGKSFTAVNLAMSIAMEMDHTVLLVDADVARPSLPTLLGLPPARGLLDLLVDDSIDVSDVLLKTNIEKLAVLPSGTQHVRATELLASDAMNRLLEEMAHRYSDRIIIFDSPPLLVTTEARVLATHMGQILMVVQAQRTAHADVQHALATIESCPVKLMMLNKGRSTMQGGYAYGYGYGYGYGS